MPREKVTRVIEVHFMSVSVLIVKVYIQWDRACPTVGQSVPLWIDFCKQLFEQ